MALSLDALCDADALLPRLTASLCHDNRARAGEADDAGQEE
jgi:hypothetical protein